MPQSSSYWKGSLQFTIDYGRQYYIILYTVNVILEVRPPSKKRGVLRVTSDSEASFGDLLSLEHLFLEVPVV